MKEAHIVYPKKTDVQAKCCDGKLTVQFPRLNQAAFFEINKG